MKTMMTMALAMLSLGMFTGDAFCQHYYGEGRTIELQIDSAFVTLCFDEATSPMMQQAILSSFDRIDKVMADAETVDSFIVCSLSVTSGYHAFLDSLSAVSAVDHVEPYYRSAGGSRLLVGRQFCVAFHEGVTMDEIDALNAVHGVVVDRTVPYMDHVFVMRRTSTSGARILDIANTYYEHELTRYSHPVFAVRPVLNSYQLYDHYHDYQPHTKKVIGQFNQASVWDFPGLTTPITVAVIDDGVAPHEDLPASRLLSGWDFVGADRNNIVPDADPSPGPLEAHGMGCAGILAASHTTDPGDGQLTASGVISMNPHVMVLPVKMFDDTGRGTYGPDVPASAISYAWQQGADILSNSWGYVIRDLSYDILNDAIERAYAFGRNGRGCPVIFSSGNTSWLEPDPYGVGYPARLEQCIAVGASDLSDYRWGYSFYGPELDLVAPSDDGYTVGVWSLDQMGALGWNPAYMSDCPPTQNDQNYDCRFGGTSAACPLVSGTAALLLSKDSTLSAAAVYYILRHSAETNLDWGTITPPNQQYGHGRLDAFRAILSISRGEDFNGDGSLNVADMTLLIGYLYSGGPEPFPSRYVADLDCDGHVNISDMTYLINFLFSGGPKPVTPCFKP